MNLTGSVNLLKLEKAGIATIKNKKCVVIPIEENDLYVSMDENLKAKAVYLNVNINERREPSQYGKQYLSKQYKDANKAEAEAKSKVYLGDFKPYEFEGSGNAAATVDAPSLQTDGEDNLPF